MMHKSLDWRRELITAVKDIPSLLTLLELDPEAVSPFLGKLDFPILVPLNFLNRIEKGNPRDPLLLQVLASEREKEVDETFVKNPLQEVPIYPGILKKYEGRVLWIVSTACAIHCRYCFRRFFPYSEIPSSLADINQTIDFLGQLEGWEELLLSGGDPLMLSDRLLAYLFERIGTLKPLSIVRIHTRLPVVIPSRVTETFLSLIRQQKKKVVIVLHINHDRELSEEVIQALLKLKAAGAQLFNQSVLLKGVNHRACDQMALLKKLFLEAGVLPYYLHCLDKVEGSLQFETSEEEKRDLLEALRAKLPGYLVPKLVREVPGARYKVPI